MFIKILQKLRKHKFDLDNPRIVDIGISPMVEAIYSNGAMTVQFNSTRKHKVYKCKNCGKELSLELWQMKQLPWQMARGCPKAT